ncbi:MAG: hypothetical protein NTW59_02890 [Candidatus Diapherotrites archaeon]|nr:hypothetical protein [Candidatus Diapherotrites archaeon]
MKGPKALVPLLSKREADPVFIGALAGNQGEIILLVVIDTNAMPGQFGFAANDIAGGSQLMEKIRDALELVGKHCADVIEWGDTAMKIEHLALLKGVERIFVVEQDNQYYKKLLRELREKLGKIEFVEVRLPAEEKKR